MKIAFFEVFKTEEKIIKDFFKEHDVICFEEKLNEETSFEAREAEVISIFINSEINQNIIDSLPNLKFIATRSTGYDHIDHKYAESKGIKVSNVPAYGTHTVAEYTFALLLSLSRKIYIACNHLKQDADFSISALQGFDLYKKTIGIVGTGKIGKNVIKIAKGFGMNVVAFDLYPDLEFAKENNFEYKNLNDLVAESDVLSLHIPYTKENYHLINKKVISEMKKGMYLINTARGELIDTDALIWGLESKVIGGAGLDVLESERELKTELEVLSHIYKAEKVKDYKTLLEDRVLIDMPNVIVSPHIAFFSKEAEDGIVKVTMDNINGFINNFQKQLI